jgi:hypothetical protein
MRGIADKRARRRFGRRSAVLVALGLVSSLGAAGALAAISVNRSTPGPSRDLAVRVTPSRLAVRPGATAIYMVRVGRDHHRAIGLSGRTGLVVRRTGLPTGSTAQLSDARALGAALHPRARTTLTITTATGTPAGTYEVRLGARRRHRRGSATVELVVSGAPPSAIATGGSEPPPEAATPGPPGPPAPPVPAPPDAFTIAGALPQLLTPGTGEALDLTLTDLESTDLVIASLNVQVSAVSGPQRDLTHTCDPEDFSVEQFSGAPGFTLPAAGSVDLGELGFSPSQWPRVSMLDRPVNQDGCKGASLTLTFTGTATEATS